MPKKNKDKKIKKVREEKSIKKNKIEDNLTEENNDINFEFIPNINYSNKNEDLNFDNFINVKNSININENIKDNNDDNIKSDNEEENKREMLGINSFKKNSKKLEVITHIEEDYEEKHNPNIMIDIEDSDEEEEKLNAIKIESIKTNENQLNLETLIKKGDVLISLPLFNKENILKDEENIDEITDSGGISKNSLLEYLQKFNFDNSGFAINRLNSKNKKAKLQFYDNGEIFLKIDDKTILLEEGLQCINKEEVIVIDDNIKEYSKLSCVKGNLIGTLN